MKYRDINELNEAVDILSRMIDVQNKRIDHLNEFLDMQNKRHIITSVVFLAIQAAILTLSIIRLFA